jgi:hypothetical protein
MGIVPPLLALALLWMLRTRTSKTTGCQPPGGRSWLVIGPCCLRCLMSECLLGRVDASDDNDSSSNASGYQCRTERPRLPWGTAAAS